MLHEYEHCCNYEYLEKKNPGIASYFVVKV